MSLKTRTVYIISSALTPKVYIGSTSIKLCSRMSVHRDKKSNCTAKSIIQFGDAKISPLCIVENCSRKEIELKEKDYILMMQDIAVNITHTKGWNEPGYKPPCTLDGRTKIKNKEWYQNNKDKILEEKKIKYQNNKDKILEENKIKYQNNKDKLLKKIECECGGSYSLNSKVRHFKTKKHLNFSNIII